MSSFQYGPLDASLRLKTFGNVTTTTSETGVSIDGLTAMQDFKVVFFVSGFNLTSDEQVVFSVESDSVVAFSDAPVTQVTLPAISGDGEYELCLSGHQISQHDADAAALRVVATVSGTSPAFDYKCYIAPAH